MNDDDLSPAERVHRSTIGQLAHNCGIIESQARALATSQNNNGDEKRLAAMVRTHAEGARLYACELLRLRTQGDEK